MEDRDQFKRNLVKWTRMGAYSPAATNEVLGIICQLREQEDDAVSRYTADMLEGYADMLSDGAVFGKDTQHAIGRMEKWLEENNTFMSVSTHADSTIIKIYTVSDPPSVFSDPWAKSFFIRLDAVSLLFDFFGKDGTIEHVRVVRGNVNVTPLWFYEALSEGLADFEENSELVTRLLDCGNGDKYDCRDFMDHSRGMSGLMDLKQQAESYARLHADLAPAFEEVAKTVTEQIDIARKTLEPPIHKFIKTVNEMADTAMAIIKKIKNQD